ADPYPVFHELRARGELLRHDGLGLYLTLSHSAASAVLRHRGLGRMWTDAAPAEAFKAFNLLHRNSLLESEPPRHTRLRRLISAAFARGHTERLRPWVNELAARLVDQLAERIEAGEPADLIETVAGPLPVAVIAELLGVPEQDRARLRPWSNAIVKMYEYGLPAPVAAAAERAAQEFVDYLRELAVRRSVEPRDDLISDLAQTEGLTADELVGTAVLLLMAGHEATVNVVGNGVNALLHNEDQWRLLVRE